MVTGGPGARTPKAGAAEILIDHMVAPRSDCPLRTAEKPSAKKQEGMETEAFPCKASQTMLMFFIVGLLAHNSCTVALRAGMCEDQP